MATRVTFAEEWEDSQGGGGPTGTSSRHTRAGSGHTTTDSSSSASAIPGMSGMQCPNCGSTEVESHAASGASICTDCGVVVEENNIVSSVEFTEGAGGMASAVGNFVSAGSSRAFSAGRYGFGRESREQTLANGRRRIADVASRLRLGMHFVDSAHRLYAIAVEKNFVQGRRTSHVTAACLYIACRQEKSQHMLIDFSDALQVNVYALGTTFLKFRRLLGLKLSIVDPALYVYRFAAHLDLDEKATAVALTALRIVARMKRDWIITGRRPAGICAAALLIAARAHGFRREDRDVTRILRVCGMTVDQRVREFEQTPSANLTMNQLVTEGIDVEAECDPPIYIKNRIREARALAIQEKNISLLNSGALDDPRLGSRAAQWRKERKQGKTQKQKNIESMYQSLEEEMKNDEEEAVMIKMAAKGEDNEGEKKIPTEEEGKVPLSEEASAVVTQDDEVQAVEGGNGRPKESSGSVSKDGPAAASGERQIQLRDAAGSDQIVPAQFVYPKGPNGRPLQLPHQASAEELQPPTVPAEGTLDMNVWKEAMPDLTVDEVDDLFRDEEEVKAKEVIFNRMNQDYIVREEKRESERQEREKESKDRENDEAEQEEKRARYLRKKDGRGKRGREDGDPTIEEALMAEISRRKISRKINYDAMTAIFDDNGGLSTENLEDGPGPGPEDVAFQDDPLFGMI